MRVSQNTPENYMNETDAKRTAKAIVQLLEDLKINYWFDYGVLLGAVRNHSFIPWDTDIEINFKYHNQQHINQLKFMLEMADLNVEVTPYYLHVDGDGFVGMSLSWFPENVLTKIMGMICYNLPTKVRMAIIKAVHEIYCKSTNETIRPDDGLDREQKWHCRLIRQMLPIFFCHKLRKEPFYDMSVNVPGKAEELLYLRYGKDWVIPKKKYESFTT